MVGVSLVFWFSILGGGGGDGLVAMPAEFSSGCSTVGCSLLVGSTQVSKASMP